MEFIPYEQTVINGKAYIPDQACTHGVVYLMQCTLTGECKVGCTSNPFMRLRQIVHLGRRLGRDMAYVWSIVTTNIGQLERSFIAAWNKYRIDSRREWLLLPHSEIAFFRSIASAIWRWQPTMTSKRKKMLSGRPPLSVKIIPPPTQRAGKVAERRREAHKLRFERDFASEAHCTVQFVPLPKK